MPAFQYIANWDWDGRFWVLLSFGRHWEKPYWWYWDDERSKWQLYGHQSEVSSRSRPSRNRAYHVCLEYVWEWWLEFFALEEDDAMARRIHGMVQRKESGPGRLAWSELGRRDGGEDESGGSEGDGGGGDGDGGAGFQYQ